MSSIKSVRKALYAIHTAEDKLAAARVAAIEWETLAREWQDYATDESLGRFADAVFKMCGRYLYKIFVSEGDKELSRNVYAALKALEISAQLWESMASEDE